MSVPEHSHAIRRSDGRVIAGLDRLLMFSDFGAIARRNMTLAWVSLAGFILVDAIWLPASRLGFAPNNWKFIFGLAATAVAVLTFCALVTWRLRGSTDRIGAALFTGVARVELLWRAIVVIGVSALSGLIYCYLATGAGLPLQDGLLAAIDRSMGFDWLGFLNLSNANADVARLLVAAYKSTEIMLLFTLIWLSALGQGGRLAEFLALLCLCNAGVAIGLIALPAAGAYAFYKPLAAQFSNFSADAGMWHYSLLLSLRNAAAPIIDFTVPNGMVTFPSFHTVLGIITTYALRGSRLTLYPALAINTAMIVSTLPEGGHHLVDLFAGAAICAGAIMIVRMPERQARAAAPMRSVTAA